MTREEAIKVIKDNWPEGRVLLKLALEFLIPELKDSEDERIRKSIIDLVEKQMPKSENKKWMIDWLERQKEVVEEYEDKLDRCACESFDKGYKAATEKIDAIENFDTEFEKQVSHLIASAINKEHEYNEGFVKWTANALLNYAKQELEKQCEQKTLVKIKLKFKAGDWIINSAGTLRHILAVGRTGYETNKGWLTYDIYENGFHLWTINDAKDGDVLYECNEKKPFIFKELKTKHIGDIASYCDIFNGAFNPNEDNWTTLDIVPATKEQCDLLFSKMKEAGYKWDSEKKELKKIEHNPTWSEEDEHILEAIIKEIEANKAAGPEYDEKVYDMFLSWLKSLKERYTWKPNNEQIEALLKLEEMHVLEHEKNQENAHLYMVIKSLKEQLFKLKGE